MRQHTRVNSKNFAHACNKNECAQIRVFLRVVEKSCAQKFDCCAIKNVCPQKNTIVWADNAVRGR